MSASARRTDLMNYNNRWLHSFSEWRAIDAINSFLSKLLVFSKVSQIFSQAIKSIYEPGLFFLPPPLN